VKETHVAIGPVDIITLKFPTTRPGHGLGPALANLASTGLIRVLDLLFVAKDADGTIEVLTLANLGPELAPSFAAIAVLSPGKLDNEDVEDVEGFLEPGTSAAILAFENTWAADFVTRLFEAGAVLVDSARLPHDTAEEVFAELTEG
jgi:hypothetical protein